MGAPSGRADTFRLPAVALGHAGKCFVAASAIAGGGAGAPRPLAADFDRSPPIGGTAPEDDAPLLAGARPTGIFLGGTAGAGGRPAVCPQGGAPEPATDTGAEPAVIPLGAALAAEAPLVLLDAAHAKLFPPYGATSFSGPWPTA